jgi:hypothetical protein
MAVVRTSAAVSSITLATSGVVATSTDTGYNAGSAIFTCTAAEATALCTPVAQPTVDSIDSLTTGVVEVAVGDTGIINWASASTITYPMSSITINGNVYTWQASNSALASVSAVDAKAFICYGFKLVTG